jgi:hypothetical protein
MEEMLKSWQVGSFTCKLWRQSDTVLRGCVFLGAKAVACAEVLSQYGEERAVRAVEALVPVMQRPDGAWHITERTPVCDLIFVPQRGRPPGREDRLQEPLKLAEDIEVIPVDRSLAQLIFDSCDPPGHNKGFSIDLRAPLYAIVRYNAPREESLRRWDPDERLRMCLALSRLVRATSAALDYAVRIIGDLRGAMYEIVPGPVREFGSKACTPMPNRDWLSPDELRELQRIVERFTADPLPPKSRLSQALWYNEYVARTYFVDIRWTLVVTALETLLSTDANQSTRHFTKRLPALADRVNAASISNREASRIWSLRSSLVHGAKHGGLGAADFVLYEKLEDVLRATLKKAVLDLSFRSIFLDAERIAAEFPIPDPPVRKIACPRCRTTFEAPR